MVSWIEKIEMRMKKEEMQCTTLHRITQRKEASHSLAVPLTAVRQRCEDTVLPHELLVRPMLLDLSIVDDDNPVTHEHDLHLVGDHDRRPAVLHSADRVHDRSLILGIQR